MPVSFVRPCRARAGAVRRIVTASGEYHRASACTRSSVGRAASRAMRPPVVTEQLVLTTIHVVEHSFPCNPVRGAFEGGRVMVRRGLLFAVVFLLFASVAGAQTVAIAQLSGVVKDESGGALPGADVKVTQTTTGLTRFVTTGSGGEYVIPNLPVGPYQLDVTLSGFSGYQQKGITLEV